MTAPAAPMAPTDRAAPARPRRPAGRRAGLAWLALACGLAVAPLHAAEPAGAHVYTRATVRALPEPGAAEPLVRLKILPRGKLPFSTLSFRVPHPGLLQGLRVGDEVGFVAQAQAGGNTLVRIRKVAPCVRFQPCPEIVGD